MDGFLLQAFNLSLLRIQLLLPRQQLLHLGTTTTQLLLTDRQIAAQHNYSYVRD